MRVKTIAFLLLCTAGTVSAQIGRRGYARTPQYWVGLSYGYMDGTTITDGSSGQVWRFGYSSQIRATAEKAIQGGASVGISAGFANAPLVYTGGSFIGNGAEIGCNGCDATADITQYMAFLHGGSGVGFHGVYNLEAGATQFSNFRAKTGNEDLRVPSKYDFSFGFGGGLGYGFSPTTDGYVAEMLDLVLHDQGSTVSSSAPRFMTFRLGFRVGF
jgi:hypothetical protein